MPEDTAKKGDAAGGDANSESEKEKKPRVDWEDPNVPLGNAPPLPRWPVAVAGIAWLALMVFLVLMLLSRSVATAG